MDQNNGGILGKINTPTTTVASGVWSLDSQFEAQSSSIWPLAFPQTTIANSCRFNQGSSDYLQRTPSGAGNRRTWTLSCWIKRGVLGSDDMILSQGTSSGSLAYIYFNTEDRLGIAFDTEASGNFRTGMLFRDQSAWYHIVVACDTTQGTAGNRVKSYVNGSQVTFSTESQPAENYQTQYNTTTSMDIGRKGSGSGNPFDGYMAEYIFIDGQQLEPSSFGAFNPVTNIWEPIAYAGTYGTNGFRLDFANSSALGNDVSGNDNDFTANNLTSIDQSTDTCSNNFATLNPLHFGSDAGTVTMSQGNTTFSNSGNDTWRSSTMAVSQGKWYAEFKATGTATASGVGINNGIQPAYIGSNSYDYIYGFNGIVYNNDSNAGGSFTAPSTNDIIGVALDLDNNKIYWSLNGTFLNSGDPTSGSTGTGAISISTSNPSGFYHFAVGDAGTGTVSFECNFGGSPSFSISSGNTDANGFGNFEYAVPSGYFALCTKNLAENG